MFSPTQQCSDKENLSVLKRLNIFQTTVEGTLMEIKPLERIYFFKRSPTDFCADISTTYK